MGVVVGPAAQAPTNVEQGKEIATLMLTVLAIYNVVKTTVSLHSHSHSLQLMTAAMNQVRHFKLLKKTAYISYRGSPP